jgi:hypothetical protein
MSSVIISARSSRSRSISSASRSSTCLRLRGATIDHAPPSNERRAAATARSTSSASHAATSNSVSPDTGLTHSNVAPDAASTKSPSTNAWRRKWLVSGNALPAAVVAICVLSLSMSASNPTTCGADRFMPPAAG